MYNSSMDLSIVIPVYSEVESLKMLYDGFKSSLGNSLKWELLFVNDGNIHNDVFLELEKLKSYNEVTVIHLSRNFGQHIAITAGLKNCKGEYVLVTDADLQYLPEECVRLYKVAKQKKSAALVGVFAKSEHGWIKRVTAKAYYKVMHWLGWPLSRTDLSSTYVMKKYVVEGLLKMNDRVRATVPLMTWLCGEIDYERVNHQKRPYGKSSYTLVKLVKHAVNGITSFSTQPLYLALYISFVFVLLFLSAVIFYAIKIWVYGETYLPGWASTLMLILIVTSITLGCMGVMGIYIARIFEISKGRPLYFVRKNPDSERAKLFEDL